MSYFDSHPIRLVEFNVENLFVFLDFYSGQDLSTLTEKEWQRLSASTIANKPLAQVRELALAVREMDPDILMLCEVGGSESLANFSRYFLDDLYAPYLLEGNSDRGIDIGYLIKRSLPFTFDLSSHKHREIEFLYPHEKLSQETGYDDLGSARLKSHRFSRDVLELRVFEDPEKPPVLITLLVHLKSQLDRDRIDPQGRDRRRAELEKLVGIYKEIHNEFQGQTPVVIAGDLNGIAAEPNPDSEFEALYRETKLQDCLEIAGVPLADRFTFMQLHARREGYNKQLDYILVPPELANRVDPEGTSVFRFRDAMGVARLVPKTLNEKRLLPSDHYPVVLMLRAGTR